MKYATLTVAQAHGLGLKLKGRMHKQGIVLANEKEFTPEQKVELIEHAEAMQLLALGGWKPLM